MKDIKQLRQELKKRIDAGLYEPAGEGLIISYSDREEYKQSKDIGGFVWQMPIALHVRAGGAGQYEETITKYLSISEAYFLAYQLLDSIYKLEEPPRIEEIA